MRLPSHYRSFENPFAGLAAMIFAQAFHDADILKKHGKERMPDHDGWVYTMDDIRKFCRSEWAEYLASFLKLDIRDVRRWAATL